MIGRLAGYYLLTLGKEICSNGRLKRYLNLNDT